MTSPFIHLHLHTEYSLVDSLIRINPLIDTVRKLGIPACAMTDQSNLFGLIKFYRAAQAAGIKPLVGVDMWLHNDTEPPSRALFLCQNDIGYRNLTRLVSKSYTEGQLQGKPYLRYAWLKDAQEGLIVLSGGAEGNIGQALLAGRVQEAQQALDNWLTLFPQRFYLQLQRTGKSAEEDYLHAAVELALAQQIPIVATNEVCFLSAEDFETHEVRVCIHDGDTLADTRRPHRYTPQQYLRTPQEMAELFADIPEALENTWHIAQRCNVTLNFGENYLPDFPLPEGQTTASYFRDLAQQGLEHRFAQLSLTTEEARLPYQERLQRELEVIEQMGFPGYFLIVADFIQWAKDHDIPVGPGRGSGAGSLVAYALGITDLDPLKYELLFERFLNPERVSMPDFDIDFCIQGRDDVIKYVANRYGQNRVSQIITYGTLAAKAVVRDVGRVLGHPYGFVDRIAKLIPFELGITIGKALENNAELKERYQQEEEVRTLIDIAQRLEGLTRNVGTHAGGVVIAPSDLTDFTPLYCQADGNDIVSQFDKNDIENIGLIKFDFLGLRTLTIIKWALRNIQQVTQQQIDMSRIPLDDSETLRLLQRGDTTAVFQLESAGLKRLIRRLKPDCFEDLVALVALYRPGPLQSGMVDDFIERKHGRAKIEYLHPQLTQVLKPTYGVILYQEQVMKIAQILAGYTLGGADLLRRAMGKKDPKKMAEQRTIFVEGSVARGTKEETASYIFDLMEKFAGYGFNRSHSVAYALIAYQTAWLKAHYPAAFMAAVMSSELDNTDKIMGFITECRSMGLQVLPPDINLGQYEFTIKEAQSRAIYYGLGAIKGVGESAIQDLVQERQKKGQFTDLFDFCQRIDVRKVNRRALESLAKSGAFDALSPQEFGKNRAIIMASLGIAIKLAEQYATNQSAGQTDLFGFFAPAQEKSKEKPFVIVPPWSQAEELRAEKESLGGYLTGHPADVYATELNQLTRTTLANVRANGNNTRVGGWLTELRVNKNAQGRVTLLSLEDSSGQLEVIVHEDVYNTKKDILVKETLLIVEGSAREDKYNNTTSFVASNVLSLSQARERYAKRLLLTIHETQVNDKLVEQLLKIFESYRSGQCVVVIRYQRTDAQVELTLGQGWRVKVAATLVAQLADLLGEKAVEVSF